MSSCYGQLAAQVKHSYQKEDASPPTWLPCSLKSVQRELHGHYSTGKRYNFNPVQNTSVRSLKKKKSHESTEVLAFLNFTDINLLKS